ncbi:hypothetical protein C0J52_03004 [Blattella germanica]|nr:hypothetical protein C0J52_03004 [Blattella germanica]
MLIKESSVFQECDQENIQNWLECDVDDPGHRVLTDDEIIASVIDDQDLCDEEEEPSDEDCAEKGPSAMKWVEQQEECDAVQLLCLKRLRDLAAKKRVSKHGDSRRARGQSHPEARGAAPDHQNCGDGFPFQLGARLLQDGGGEVLTLRERNDERRQGHGAVRKQPRSVRHGLVESAREALRMRLAERHGDVQMSLRRRRVRVVQRFSQGQERQEQREEECGHGWLASAHALLYPFGYLRMKTILALSSNSGHQ